MVCLDCDKNLQNEHATRWKEIRQGLGNRTLGEFQQHVTQHTLRELTASSAEDAKGTADRQLQDGISPSDVPMVITPEQPSEQAVIPASTVEDVTQGGRVIEPELKAAGSEVKSEPGSPSTAAQWMRVCQEEAGLSYQDAANLLGLKGKGREFEDILAGRKEVTRTMVNKMFDYLKSHDKYGWVEANRYAIIGALNSQTATAAGHVAHLASSRPEREAHRA